MKMFPIQDGPRVPWEVMAPHEAQCVKNHSQSLERIAERGGFGAGEAWLVVNGLPLFPRDPQLDWDWKELKKKWNEYAERVNLHYDELEKSREQLKEDIVAMSKAEERILLLEAVMRNLVKGIDWNAAVRNIANVPEHEWPALEEARELLKVRP
jgi:hypothetical protein